MTHRQWVFNHYLSSSIILASLMQSQNFFLIVFVG